MLSRKKNEVIVIGGEIEVVVNQISNGHVRLGIRAPRHVNIVRKEILDASLDDAPKEEVEA